MNPLYLICVCVLQSQKFIGKVWYLSQEVIGIKASYFKYHIVGNIGEWLVYQLSVN